MARFKVTYVRPVDDEVIEADYYLDVKNWIVFYNQDLAGTRLELLRLKSAGITRIDRLPDEEDEPD